MDNDNIAGTVGYFQMTEYICGTCGRRFSTYDSYIKHPCMNKYQYTYTYWPQLGLDGKIQELIDVLKETNKLLRSIRGEFDKEWE
jgi:hypothetical protein